MRRKAQTEGCIAGLRQKYPARPGRTLPCLRRGRCLHRPGNPAVAQGPRGGRNRPPYIAAASGQQRTNAGHPPGPPAGLVPAQKDTRKARCRTPPSPGATPPLAGEASGRQSLQSLPCKGRWMRRKAQTEGCIAGLRQKYPARPGRTLPCLRRGRCLHRPGNPAVAQGPRGGRNRPPYIAAGSGQQRTNASHPSSPPAGRCKHRPLRRGAASAGCAAGCRSRSRRPYALHCRAGVHARRGGLGRGDAVVLRKRRIARPGRSEANREGIGKGWERHPQGAADKPSAVTPAGSKFRW